MKPVVFSGTIGWLSEAEGARGVVIAGAFGFEDLCSRRFLRRLADRIAAAGLPVLRFDYPGCGDALGDHQADGLVQAWTESIGAAVDCLKRETGVGDVLVVGFRLGALLAPLAVAGRPDIAGLALLAPPVSGKAHLREMTGLSRMIDAALPARPAGIGEAPFNGLEVAGFRLSPATMEALKALDWKGPLQEAGMRNLLLMPAVETPAIAALAESIRGAGSAVTLEPFEGYSRLMCDPTTSEIPQGTLDRCTAWMVANVADGRRRTPQPSGARELVGEDFVEEPVLIDYAPRMAGVFCRPRDRAGVGEALIFLNAGAVPHVGWARGTVDTARALAALGIASLRIDLPGLGDSDMQPEGRLFLYDRRTGADVGRAIDWLDEAGYPHVGLAGICAGAFQAFHAARVDKRVQSLTMVNPLCFAWNASYALETSVWKTYESSKITLGYDKAAPRSGEVGWLHRFAAIASRLPRRLARRGLEINKTVLTRFSAGGLLRGRPVERWMRELTARGVEVMMVVSEGDLSQREIDRHFDAGAKRLKAMEGVRFHALPAADHTLTPRHARLALIDRLAELCRDDDRASSGVPAAPNLDIRPIRSSLP